MFPLNAVQEDNGMPVHLKGGTGDALLYRATMAMTVFGKKVVPPSRVTISIIFLKIDVYEKLCLCNPLTSFSSRDWICFV